MFTICEKMKLQEQTEEYISEVIFSKQYSNFT